MLCSYAVDPKIINKRGIYKDTVGSASGWADYQLRPNLVRSLLSCNSVGARVCGWDFVLSIVCADGSILAQAVAMAVAPDLFVTEHAQTALSQYETLLLGRHQLGTCLCACPYSLPCDSCFT